MNANRFNIWMLTLLGILTVVGSAQASRIIDADLSISLSQNMEVLSSASNLVISMDIENSGPDSAEGVVLKFSLDSTHGKEAFRVLSVEDEDWTCSSETVDESIDYSCERAMLEANTLTTVSVSLSQGVIESQASFGIQASVSSEIMDIEASNNSAYLVIPIASSVADLDVEMSSDHQIVNPEENINFTITIQNLGPDNAENVELLFNLPEGMLVNQIRGDGITCLTPENQENGTLCQLESIEPEETRELILDAIAPSSGSPLLPSVFVSSDAYDPVPQNNSAFYDLALAEERVDLALTLVTEAEFAEPGGLIDASFMIENIGGVDAGNVVLAINRLDRTDLVFVESEGWNCLHVEENLSSVCTRESLAVNSISEINMQVLVSSDFEQETLSVLASVSSDAFDENTENDFVELAVATFIERSDLVLTGSINSEVVLVGEAAQYVLQIENLGPSDASEVSVVISLPPNATHIDSGNEQWDCSSILNQDLLETSCQIAKIGAAQIETLNISYRFDEAVDQNDLTASFVISSGLPDPNYENNLLLLQSQVLTGQADLAVTVEGGSDAATFGSQIPFAIRTENFGPDSVSDTIVRAIPPIGVRISSLLGDGWTCEIIENSDLSTGQCQRDDLQPGSSSSIDVMLSADEGFTLNHVELTAFVQSNQFDANSLNNTSTDDVRYFASSADLSIAQDVVVNLENEIAHYSLTIQNHGRSDASNIRVTNLLPFSAEWIGLESDIWACEPDSTEGLAAICSLDSLAVGSTSILEYEIDITELVGSPEMINFLTVSSNQFDPVSSNNSLLAAVTLE